MGETAGGSPNEETFLDNPQFMVFFKFPEIVRLLNSVIIFGKSIYGICSGPASSKWIGFSRISYCETREYIAWVKYWIHWNRGQGKKNWSRKIVQWGYLAQAWRLGEQSFRFGALGIGGSNTTVSVFGKATEKAVTEHNFFIIPSTFKPGVEKKFELLVYSDNPSKLQLLGEVIWASRVWLVGRSYWATRWSFWRGNRRKSERNWWC